MNHERAMNRLTDMLRNAQTTCTDTECFTGPCKIGYPKNQRHSCFCLVPGLQNPATPNTGMTNMYLMLAIWFAIALLLFFFRPRTLRNNRDTVNKPRNQVRSTMSIRWSSCNSCFSSRAHIVMVKIHRDHKSNRI